MKDLRFIEKMIQGRIGKRFVIKHYKTYKVKTKVPDMSGIVPSTQQKRQRRLFRLAVQYAQEIYWNPKKRAEKERIYRRPWRLFQKLMKEWFKKRQAKREAAQRRMNIWKRNVEMNRRKDWTLVVDKSVPLTAVGDCFPAKDGTGVLRPRNDGRIGIALKAYDS